jgi:hypothetical protein
MLAWDSMMVAAVRYGGQATAPIEVAAVFLMR